MPLLESVPVEGHPELVMDRFDVTVKMSTYLLAIAVGKFASISGTSDKNTKVSVYAPEHQLADANFSLEVGIRGLETLESFFNISFPLPKQDLLAVSDFSAGAMENWGLITFRDQILLWNPERSSVDQKELTASVIVHELAHQWFGNLVTMKWWNDLWLNEGFAAFIEYFGTAKVFPEWKLMERFYSENIMTALGMDGLGMSHPISMPVADPADIGSIFDAISYQKGASIINMLMSIAGESAFREGLTDYLNTYKYGNSEGNDLWSILDKHIGTADGLSLLEFARTWTTQVGYPLLRPVLKGSTLSVSQERFFYLERLRGTNNSLWPIQITYRTDSDPSYSSVWMKNVESIEIPLNLDSSPSWLQLNANGSGFYRVIYSEETYTAIGNALKRNVNVLSAGDRASLVYDAFSLAKAGLLPIESAMDLVGYMDGGNEADVLPLEVAFNQLNLIEELVWDTDFFLDFKKFGRELVSPLYEQIGWDVPSEHVERLRQSIVILQACRLEMEDCVGKAKEKFETWLLDENYLLPPDLRFIIIKTGVKYGNDTVWDIVYERYTRSSLPSEQSKYLQALAESRNPWILNRYLSMMLDTHKVKPNLIARVLVAIAKNPTGKYVAWRFLREKWEELKDLMGLTSMLGNSMKATAIKFSTEFDLKEVKDFFADKEIGLNKRKLDEILEVIEIHIQWRSLNERRLKQWLASKPHN